MQYFKHHANMRHDIKIKRTVAKYGLEGYGLYCLILESITESLSTDSPIPSLQETCEDIAEFYNGNTARIEEIVNYMISQGLFSLDELNGSILCHKLYKFLDTSQTRSIELRNMIKAYKSNTCDLSETVSDKYDRIEENKNRKEVEENKNTPKKETKNKYGEYNNVRLTKTEYDKLIEDWTEAETLRMIKELDEGIALKGYKYKSHNLALRKWKSNEVPTIPTSTIRQDFIPI